MADPRMMTQISGKPGFLAALDQSGGSTPGALRTYGIPTARSVSSDRTGPGRRIPRARGRGRSKSPLMQPRLQAIAGWRAQKMRVAQVRLRPRAGR
jgi:fructose-bisphosphate aldolase class 1